MLLAVNTCQAMSGSRAMEQSRDHPTIPIKSARRGVTEWIQQRLLKAPNSKENAPSLLTPASGETGQLTGHGPPPGYGQTSPPFITDRLCFSVSLVMVDPDPSPTRLDTMHCLVSLLHSFRLVCFRPSIQAQCHNAPLFMAAPNRHCGS